MRKTVFQHIAWRPARWVVSLAACTALAGPAVAWDMSYLQGLLATTPEGGWVQANTTTFSSAWATQAEGGLPPGTYSDGGAIVRAWSSFAWDPNRGDLILFGGGHANYMGNEVYLWDGSTGAWSRGSLPSRIQSVAGVTGALSGEYVVVDGAAPLSQHTYENNVYLPVIDQMVMLGGASFNSGSGTRKLDGNGDLVATGPWMWDPSRANASQVGGTTGSGYLPSTLGGQMWTDRFAATTGTRGGSAVDSSTAYRLENGRDVVYAARMNQGSGWPTLYRYIPGNPDLGEMDLWQQVAVATQSKSFQSSAAIDYDNNLYVRTAFQESTGRYGLGVWNLGPANAPAASPNDTYIALEFADGSTFQTNTNFAISYDAGHSRFVLWDGSNRGEVFYVDPEFLPNGSVDPVWTVFRATSVTTAQPDGNFVIPAGNLGVLGKWQYVDELGAFMALDMYNNTTQDAGVWLYKPLSVAAVPEPRPMLLALVGMLVLAGWWRRLPRS